MLDLQFLQRMPLGSLPSLVDGWLERTKRMHSWLVLVCWDPMKQKESKLVKKSKFERAIAIVRIPSTPFWNVSLGRQLLLLLQFLLRRHHPRRARRIRSLEP